MKKVLAMILAAVLLLGAAACGTADGGKGSGGPDLGNYPESLDAWSGQDFIDYFTEAGIFTEGNGAETWLQDHATYWPGTPVNECAGWWDDMSMAMILVMSPENSDSSQEQLEEWKTSIRENKALPGDYSTITVDYLVGNIAFSYNTILDEELYNKMDTACKELFEALGVTPES